MDSLTNTFAPPRLLLILVGALMFASGCDDGRPLRVHVTGKVLYNGNPVENATVTFLSRSGRPAIGQTRADGTFNLGTFDVADGAVLGEHVVTVSKWLKVDSEKIPGATSIRKIGNSLDPKEVVILANFLPDRYGAYQRTELRAVVTREGPNDFTFELSD